MRILLIGNFAPPFEDDAIHNISLFLRLKKEGHECSVINISQNPSGDAAFINSGSYIDFVLKVIRYSWNRDVIHFFTKGYTRLGLLKLMTSILVGRLFRTRPIITLHSELFSLIGQMRSKVGGQQTVYLSFSFAHKIIFQDRDTFNTASKYRRRNNFEMIPLFIHKHSETPEGNGLSFRKLRDRKRIILFSGVGYPSFIFDVLDKYLSDYVKTDDIGVAVSFTERPYIKLQHAIEETAGEMAENLVFSGPDDFMLLSEAYKAADIIIRPLNCDGEPFFHDFALYIRKPTDTGAYRSFPRGLVLVKEGDMADICAFISDAILSRKADLIPAPEEEDFYLHVKRLYAD